MLYRQLLVTLVAVQLVFTLALWVVATGRLEPAAVHGQPPDLRDRAPDELRVVEISRTDFLALAARHDGSLESTLGVWPSDRIASAIGEPSLGDHLELGIDRQGQQVRILVLLRGRAATPSSASM